MQSPRHLAVTRAMTRRRPTSVLRSSISALVVDRLDQRICALRIRPADWPALQGPHNAQNAAAAIRRSALALGVTADRSRASAPIPACRTAWSGCARRTASSSSTTARRPTRPRPRRRWPRSSNPLDSRRAGQERQSRRMRAAFRPCPLGLYHWRGGRIVRAALVAAHAGDRVRDARRGGAKRPRGSASRGHGAAVAGLRDASTSTGISRSAATNSASWWGRYDREHLGPDQGQGGAGRSRTATAARTARRSGRWFWEIDQRAAAAGQRADRHRADRGRRRLARPPRSAIRAAMCALPSFIISTASWRGSRSAIPVMIGISMMPRERARRLSLFGAAFFFVLLIFVPVPRPRDQRRQALDRDRRRPAPAVRIPQALLRRRDGLAAEPQGEGQVAAGVRRVGAAHRRRSRCC